MLMSDRDIRAQIEAGRIGLEPLEMGLLQPSSMDVRLDRFFRLFDNHKYPVIDPSIDQPELTRLIEVDPDEAFILHPGELALAMTLESVTLPDDIVGWLDGRSSLARLGLMVHVTAHRIDPGWSGNIVLEFYNSGKLPLALRPQMKIGALNFELMTGPAERPYNKRLDAKYQQQTGAVASRIGHDDKG